MRYNAFKEMMNYIRIQTQCLCADKHPNDEIAFRIFEVVRHSDLPTCDPNQLLQVIENTVNHLLPVN